MTKRNLLKDVKELRKRRKALGVTQAQLAKMSRVNANTLAQYEAGYAPLNAAVARKLWDVLDRVESERRAEVSLAERKLQERVAELEKENAVLRGVEAAEIYSQNCARLPWMKSLLPAALEQLAQVKARAARLSEQGNLNDPIIKGLLDSLYQEKEGLEKQISELQIAVPIMDKLVGFAVVNYGDALLRGEEWAVQRHKRWKETGEVESVRFEKVGTTED